MRGRKKTKNKAKKTNNSPNLLYFVKIERGREKSHAVRCALHKKLNYHTKVCQWK